MTETADIVGTEFAGRYAVLRKIDEGGMGAVYEARHRFTDERVALKVLHHSGSLSPLKRERFLREAGVSSKIDHPGIVRVLDAGETPEGQLYLVMELLEGQNLHDYYFTKGLGFGRAVEIIIDALIALEAAHAQGLVHRDIKPANLFLAKKAGGSEEVKLLDFGLIRTDTVTGVQTRQGAIMGTVRFMSPEQASGSEVDARSDIWSMGASLHQLITGLAPFEDVPDPDLFRRLLIEKPPSIQTVTPADLPSSLVEAIDVSLRRQPKDRWQSAAAMRTVLEQALSEIRSAESARRVSPAHAFEPTLAADETGESHPATLAASASGKGTVVQADNNQSLQRRQRKERISFLAASAILVAVLSGAAIWFWDDLIRFATEGGDLDNSAAEQGSVPIIVQPERVADVMNPSLVADAQTSDLVAGTLLGGDGGTESPRSPSGSASARSTLSDRQARRRGSRDRAERDSTSESEPVKPERPSETNTQQNRERIVGSFSPNSSSFRAINPNSIAAQERETEERLGLESSDTSIISGQCILDCSRENTRCVLRASRLTGREARETRIECARTNAACRRECGH